MSRESEERHALTVRFENLRPSQVQSLRAMFERWETHGRLGASRDVSYYVDGDGPFHPEIQLTTTLEDELTDIQRDVAEVSPNSFDHDPLVREFRDDMPDLEESYDED